MMSDRHPAQPVHPGRIIQRELETRRLAEAFYPGEFVTEELVAREWTLERFAEKTRLPVSFWKITLERPNAICYWDESLCYRLAYVFSTSVEFWLNLVKQYREALH